MTTRELGSTSSVGNVHVVADSDSRWKWGTSVADALVTSGDSGRVVGHLLPGRATPTDRQLAEVGATAEITRPGSLAELAVDPDLAAADIVILACVGGTVQASLHALRDAWAGRTARPLVVTGYVGVVYERLVDGLLLRAGADVVLANSASDAARFRDVYAAVGGPVDSVVQTALPFLGGDPYDPSAAGMRRRFTVCFATQPSVPPRRHERRYLLERAAQHAILHPERDVLVKLRSRPEEQTTHVERHHFTHLPVEQPPNLEFVYGAMCDVLDRTDLCVTISSTAALEAMHRGIPTAVLTDMGIRETLGNHQFLGSGTLVSWTDLDEGALPVADPDWLARHGGGHTDPYGAVRARLTELAAAQALPPLQMWYDDRNAGGYLPHLLLRAGIRQRSDEPADEGGPLHRVRRRSRVIARRGARSIYRLSVRHVEPAVRRWAQL